MTLLILIILLVVGIFLTTALFGAPYVPSHRKDTEKAFEKLYPLSNQDIVVDFGCGDGVVLMAAADFKIKKAIGFELNPILALIAKWRTRKHKEIEIKCKNMLTAKLPKDMTVAYIFGLDRVMRMLLPKLISHAKEQNKDIWVISLAFEFEGMKPEKKYGPYGLYRIRGDIL